MNATGRHSIRRALALLLALGAAQSVVLRAGDAAVAGGSAVDYLEPTPFTGTIYANGSGPKTVLFTFRRTATRSGSTVRVLREYLLPNGSLAARERVTYEMSRLVSYQLEELQSGAGGSAVIAPDPKHPAELRIAFEYTESSEKKTDSEKLQPETLINDMVGPFIADHWNTLTNGTAVKFRFVALARTETVGFKLTKESETVWRGQAAIVLRMEPSSFIIAQFVDPLRFTVEKTGAHRVFQYVGRTTPSIRKSGNWQDLDALTVFDWK